jgi:hypothetical protein
MPTIPAHTSLYAKCAPAIGLGSTMCGTLTELDLSPTTSDELAGIYTDADGLYRIHGALLESDFMGKACRIRQNAFYDYLMATARGWDSKKISIQQLKRDLVEVQPFVLMERMGPINNNYWNASSGATPGGGTGTSPTLSATYNYSMVVTSQGGIPADLRWFPPRTQIFVSGRSAAGLATRTNYEVVDATVAGQNITLYLLDRNAGSAVAEGKREAPVTGVVSLLVPNVSAYESFCAQNPGLNTTQLVPFWIQETRWTLCIDEHTEKYLQALREGNKYFEKFGDVESVELNRQILADFQKRVVNTFLWNGPYSNKQTMALWRQLPIVTAMDGSDISDYFKLPGVVGRQIARKASSPGVYQQLSECGRVKDLQNAPLNIPELLEELKQIKWLREDLQIPADEIEMVVDSTFEVKLNQGLYRYMKDQFEGDLRVTIDANQFSSTKKSPSGMSVTSWPLRYPSGLTLKVVTHRAFDDFFTAHSGISIGNSGRMALIVDFGRTAYMSILESSTVNNQTGDLAQWAAVNSDALCRMKIPKKRVQLRGMKFANVVECPSVSLWIENIADAIPEHRAAGNNDSIELGGAYTPQAAPVVFSPAAQSYTTSMVLTLGTSEVPGWEIRYTVNGDVPTSASTLYNGPVTLTTMGAVTVKAIVVKPGYQNSVIGSAVYTRTA